MLVDDEPLARDALEALLGKIPGMEVSEKCADAVSALQVLHNREIDLLFLDINMPELSGLEMLRSLSNPPCVIFTTAYREFAADAFELDVLDYLVKPISFERLVKAVNRFHERFSQNEPVPEKIRKTITIYSDKKTYRLDVDEIFCIEGLKDYARVHTSESRLITRETMKNLADELEDHGFIRVHRSWIVPVQKIISWTSYSLNVGEKEIPIGKTYRNLVMNKLKT